LQLQTLIRSFSPMVSLWNLQFFDPMPCRSAKLLSMLALLYLLPFERVEAHDRLLADHAGGDGGPATSAQLSRPSGIALDPAGNLFIADSANSRVRKLTPAGIITTVAGIGDTIAVGLDAAGNLFIADSAYNRIRKVTPTGIISTVAGNQMTLSVNVPALQQILGPFSLTSGVEKTWPACRYP